MPKEPRDDVIRIRIDATRAVEAFLALLDQQAVEGETAIPSNPAATAIWRELAPFRLVEYGYVSDGIGPIGGAYVGFADGGLYSVEDDIPEEAVTAMVRGNEHRAVDLPPIYVYVVLEHPAGRDAIDAFLTELSAQVGHALVGVVPGSDGRLKARLYDAEGTRGVAREGERHFSRARLQEIVAARGRRDDGRAYAVLTHAFAKHILEFADMAERDDFLGWSRTLCRWIADHGCDAAGLGFPEALRPAEAAPVPADGQPVIRLTPPGSSDAGGGLESDGAVAAARRYWSYVRRSLDEAGPVA
ncbi:hypothetical protein [Magnetospirillum sp. SS-4]|uniref:hypothetical protein n=1 Tax=Magnetospirillum sp. SS-4 TaxID=2681465 RepID=UPI00137C543A|nr:hypothetical protein [Magnetospirillum sp. SS-4]CAA7622236.1 conserved hypothetical protein [Magnetospirillum sp. SS-4]